MAVGSEINEAGFGGGKSRTADEAYVLIQARRSKLDESRLDPQPRDADDEKAAKERVLRNG